MDSNLIGCLAEYRFATMAMERELYVSFPLLDSSPYDCIIETINGLKKVQIKSVTKGSDKVRCFLRNKKMEKYSKSDVDFFAVWVKSHNGFYIFKNDEAKTSIVINKGGKYSKNFNNFAFI